MLAFSARPHHVHAVYHVGITQHRRRAEHDTIGNGEHRGVRTDPEREGEDHCRREGGAAANAAQRVLHILHHDIDDGNAAHPPTVLLYPFDGAECQSRASHGFRPR